MGKHNEFGKLGEAKATAFLEQQGYLILARNYRYLKAEIDIIAQKETTLAVVEVKSRTADFLVSLSETVDQKKIQLLVMATDHFVNERQLDVEVRFDIVTVLKKGANFELEHIKDAFYHF